MSRLYILCEGQTEERFVTDVLHERFIAKGIWVTPIVITTKRTVNRKYKGGISSYGKIRAEIKRLCGQHRNELVTTLIDYYGLPEDTPEVHVQNTDLYDRIDCIESAVRRDIGMQNFICYLSVHEYEALLFTDVTKFNLIGEVEEDDIDRLAEIRTQFDSPEHINSSVETAPSKRIMAIIPGYSKIIDGVSIANEIGFGRIKEECPHFCGWIDKIYEYCAE